MRSTSDVCKGTFTQMRTIIVYVVHCAYRPASFVVVVGYKHVGRKYMSMRSTASADVLHFDSDLFVTT